MSKASELRQEIANVNDELMLLKDELMSLNAKLDVAKCNEFYTCDQCGKRTVVSTTSLVKEHYYTEPHGCIGGDYWSFGNYIVLCNKYCKPTDIRPTHDMYSFVLDHVDQFFEVLDWHPQRNERHSMTLDDLRQKKKAENSRNYIY